jgi:HEPN domain-containing protein
MRLDAEPWWRQAQADLETAEVVLVARRFYAVAWFAQQAVEKGLKALYVERRGVLAPRTHDLQFLGHEVSIPPILDTDLAQINPTFDLTRYPSPTSRTAPVDLVTEQRANDNLAAARRVLRWLEQEVGLTPPSP